jgi:hypothetical protein
MDSKFAAALSSLTFQDFEVIFSLTTVNGHWENFQKCLEQNTLSEFMLGLDDVKRQELVDFTHQKMVPNNCEVHGPAGELVDFRNWMEEWEKPYFVKSICQPLQVGYADWALMVSAEDYQQFKNDQASLKSGVSHG